MKTYLLVICFLIGSYYQVKSQKEGRISLNGNWAFKTDLYKMGEKEHWYNPEHGIDGWDQMPVPGVWDTHNEYADFVGTAWYRKDFFAEENWQEKWVRVVFQAVYNDVKVWLNGQYLGDHHVGFLPFQFDISQYLQMGKKNTLVLSVDNTFKRGAIWNWGGIRRPVWLEVTDKLRLEKQYISAVPNLDDGSAEIQLSFQTSNFTQEPAQAEYEVHITKEGDHIWTSEKGTLNLPANGKTEQKVSLSLAAEQVDLWHFNFPHLYEIELRLYNTGKQIHALKDRFGIRKIEVDGTQLKLNGEAIRPVGFNVVAEDRVSGNALPLSRIKEDVDILKQLGVNMARLNHLPLPKEYLDYLDEKGIMTFEEVSLWGKDVMVDPKHPLPKYWLKKMIETKYNHPSVIGWSVGNEIGFLDRNPKVMEYVETAIKEAKELDPTRLAVYVSHSAPNQEIDPVKYSDLIMLNKYGNWGGAVDKTHTLHPGKPIFYSEYGKELNHENPNKSSIDAKGMLDSYRNKEYVIGGSLWTFNDYRSFWQAGPTWSTPPSQNRSWGIVNVFRQKKKSYYTFRKEYAPVKAMQVAKTDKKGEWELRISPRAKFDIPAYDLRGYRVLWTVRDSDNQLATGGFIDLPHLSPGDDDWQHKIQVDEQGARLKIELLDPQYYSVLDTVIDWTVPDKSSIKYIHTSNNSARVIFDKVPGAKSYQVQYGQGKLDQVSETSINDFIEIEGLNYDQEYQFAVVAINGAGNSSPSEIKRARTDEDELPPVIWKTVPSDKSFYMGYTVGKRDYMYEIQYGTVPGKYDQLIGLSNVGVCQVPNLESGTTYYYRLRRRMQWGFASEWTDERAVTLFPENPSSVSVPVQVIRQNDQAMLLFEPIEAAIGYTVTVTNKKNDFYKEIPITSAQSGYFLVDGLSQEQNYDVNLRTLKN